MLAVIEKMIKQGRESIVHYERGNRADLVDKETAEIGVLQSYLPEPLSERVSFSSNRAYVAEMSQGLLPTA